MLLEKGQLLLWQWGQAPLYAATGRAKLGRPAEALMTYLGGSVVRASCNGGSGAGLETISGHCAVRMLCSGMTVRQTKQGDEAEVQRHTATHPSDTRAWAQQVRFTE